MKKIFIVIPSNLGCFFRIKIYWLLVLSFVRIYTINHILKHKVISSLKRIFLYLQIIFPPENCDKIVKKFTWVLIVQNRDISLDDNRSMSKVDDHLIIELGQGHPYIQNSHSSKMIYKSSFLKKSFLFIKETRSK